ncbi:MAG: DUF423 domain-containing protein [Rhodospirillaceae bacterium]
MRIWLILAGVNGAMAVAGGAYAAHGLTSAGAQAVRWMELASTYQLVHAVALAVIAVLITVLRDRSRFAGWLAALSGGLMMAGIVLFCGALYGLALDAWRFAGMAPVGGFAFVTGWLCLGGAGFMVSARVAGK